MKVTNLCRKLAATLAAGGVKIGKVAVVGGIGVGLASDGYAVMIPDSGFEDHVIDDASGYAYGAASIYGDPDGFNNPSSANGGVSPWQALASGGNGAFGDNASWIFNSGYAAVNSGNQAAEVQGIFAQNLTDTFAAGQNYVATVAAAADGGDDDVVVSLYDAGAVTFLPTSTPALILNEPSLVTSTPVVTSGPYSDETFFFSAGSLASLAGKTIGIAVYSPDAGGQGPWIDDIRLETINVDPALRLDIDRDDGSLTLVNNTGSAVNISGYQITSGIGAFDPTGWVSIADNYDGDSGGAVDGTNNWTELTQADAHGDLSEGDLESGGGGSIAQGQSLNLGNAGTWIRTPMEGGDIELSYISDGAVVEGILTFGSGSGSFPSPYVSGDFDTDGDIDADDWGILRSNQHADLSALSLAEAYRQGDMTGDGENNHPDFAAFKEAFDGANGAGAFQAMLASVPEPTTVILMLTSGILVLPASGRRR